MCDIHKVIFKKKFAKSKIEYCWNFFTVYNSENYISFHPNPGLTFRPSCLQSYSTSYITDHNNITVYTVLRWDVLCLTILQYIQY